MTADHPNCANSASSAYRQTNLRQREPFMALSPIIRAVNLVEVPAQSGFDGTILDTEHGSYRAETLPNLILSAKAYSIFPIVRERCNDASLIDAALDAGATGAWSPRSEQSRRPHKQYGLRASRRDLRVEPILGCEPAASVALCVGLRRQTTKPPFC